MFMIIDSKQALMEAEDEYAEQNPEAMEEEEEEEEQEGEVGEKGRGKSVIGASCVSCSTHRTSAIPVAMLSQWQCCSFVVLFVGSDVVVSVFFAQFCCTKVCLEDVEVVVTRCIY